MLPAMLHVIRVCNVLHVCVLDRDNVLLMNGVLNPNPNCNPLTPTLNLNPNPLNPNPC